MKSKKLQLRIVPIVSAALLSLGCDRRPSTTARICVDENDRRIADEECGDRNRSPFHHWYYLSGGGAIPPLGGAAHGGFIAAPSDLHSRTGAESPDAVSRGGFGSTAHATAGS